MESLETGRKNMKNYVTFSDAALKSAMNSQKFPDSSLRFSGFLNFTEELGKFPEISQIFHGKALSQSFSGCVGTLW